MKLRHFAFLLFTVSALADFEKLPTLTIGDKVYENVTITKKNPDGISIMHNAGTTRLNYKTLPQSVIDMVGTFDAKKADQYVKEQAEQQKQHDLNTDAILKSRRMDTKLTEPITQMEILVAREQMLVTEINRRLSSLGKLGQSGTNIKRDNMNRIQQMKSELSRVQSEIKKLKTTNQ